MTISSENVGKVKEERKFPCAVYKKGLDSNSIIYANISKLTKIYSVGASRHRIQ